MFRDALDSLKGKPVNVFTNSYRGVSLKGVLLDVGQDYVVISGLMEEEINLVPFGSILTITAATV